MIESKGIKSGRYNLLRICIASVWIANGLFCKIVGWVPRHEQIVARILGETYSDVLIVMIGLSEVIMAIWILWGFKSKINAISQIIIVATMNIIEFVFAQDLLLWGKANALFAFGFILLVYYIEFHLKPFKK